MRKNLDIISAYSIMLGLIILVGFLQSWSMALSILCLCLISAVMTMGANIQWGYAGLINFGIMGYTALGGLAAVLVSVPPVREAWQVGGFSMILCAFLIAFMVFSIRFIIKKYNQVEDKYIENLEIFPKLTINQFVQSFEIDDNKLYLYVKNKSNNKTSIIIYNLKNSKKNEFETCCHYFS